MLWKMKTIFQIQLYFSQSLWSPHVYVAKKGVGRKGLRWCDFARFLVQFCRNFFLSCRIEILQNQAVCDIYIINFGVISMRFAVFLCYSVRCLYVFVRSFVVLVSPLRFPPPRKPKKVADRVRLS